MQTVQNVGADPSVGMEWKTRGEPMDTQLLYGRGIGNCTAKHPNIGEYVPQSSTTALIYRYFGELFLVQVEGRDKSPDSPPSAGQNACTDGLSGLEKREDIGEYRVWYTADKVKLLVL